MDFLRVPSFFSFALPLLIEIAWRHVRSSVEACAEMFTGPVRHVANASVCSITLPSAENDRAAAESDADGVDNAR